MSEMPGVGLPADTPARPSDPPPYPAVHDMPPARNSAVLTGLEQKKLEDDLVAAREEQQKLVGNAPAQKEAKPEARKKPGKDAKKDGSKEAQKELAAPSVVAPATSHIY